MRNMLAFFAALVLTVAGAGWYLGWYTVRTAPSAAGQRSVTFDINTAKIGEDLRAAEERVQQKLAEKSQKREAEKKAAKEPKGETTWFDLPELPVSEHGARPRSAGLPAGKDE